MLLFFIRSIEERLVLRVHIYMYIHENTFTLISELNNNIITQILYMKIIDPNIILAIIYLILDLDLHQDINLPQLSQ